jgi:hypothetical protein
VRGRLAVSADQHSGDAVTGYCRRESTTSIVPAWPSAFAVADGSTYRVPSWLAEASLTR